MPQDLRSALVSLTDVLPLPKEETSPSAALCGHTYALWLSLEDATGRVREWCDQSSIIGTGTDVVNRHVDYVCYN